ncbi:hypothetical protein Tco_1060659, partial [Tanacetum coccineum]
MSNTNNTMQTQTSNALHNAIMEAGGKDRPPMLAPDLLAERREGERVNRKTSDEVSTAQQEGLLPGLELDMIAARQKVAKEMKLFDALEHKSVVIEVGNQKFAISTKAPLWAFGEPFMRYSLSCKVDGKGAWDVELDLVDLANYVTKKVLDSMGFVHVSISDYSRKMVNDVNVEIHRVKFKADFVVLDYANEGEHSIMFGRDFLTTTKRQVNFGLGKIKMNLTMFEEVNSVIDLLEEIRSTSEEVVKMGKANRNKGYNINKLTPPPSLKLEEIPSTSTIPPQPIYYPLTSKQREKM